MHTAYAVSGVCVGILSLRTKTYGLRKTLRTLADSESVALAHSAISFLRSVNAEAINLCKAKRQSIQMVHLQGLEPWTP